MKRIVQCGTSEYTEKKSRFIAHIYNVTDEAQAAEIVARLKKKYWDARHNCYAYIVGDKAQVQRFSDDGEPSGTAGKPILEVLSGEGLTDCMCVVTRYFGGVLLGTGGLIRAYTAATKGAVETSVCAEVVDAVNAYVDADYSYVGKIQHLCEQQGITLVDTQYAQNVTFELMMEKGREMPLKDKLDEMSAGTIVLRDIVDVRGLKGSNGAITRII